MSLLKSNLKAIPNATPPLTVNYLRLGLATLEIHL